MIPLLVKIIPGNNEGFVYLIGVTPAKILNLKWNSLFAFPVLYFQVLFLACPLFEKITLAS